VATYHNDNARDGVNSNEGTLVPTLFNPNQSQSNFGLLTGGTVTVDGLIYAQPLYLTGVAVNTTNCPSSGGPYNLVLVATENNTVYAFTYAYSLGTSSNSFTFTQCWSLPLNKSNQYGNEYAIPFTALPQNSGNPCNNIVPQSGITSAPVIDTSVTPPVMYTVTAHQVPNVINTYTYTYRLHAILISRGTEASAGNAPYDLSSAFPSPVTAATENQRPGLAMFKPSSGKAYIYVAFGSYCDSGTYSGYLAGLSFTYSSQTFAQIASSNWVFDTEAGATNQHGGIWMGGAAPAVDASGNVYFAVGNGSWNGSSSARATTLGESVVKIASTSSGLQAVDYYTPNDFGALDTGGSTVCSTYGPSACPPANVLTLNTGDIDLGSGGVTLITPVGVTNACGSNHELVAGGKEGVIYGVCYSTQTGGTLQTLMGGLDGCGYACDSSHSSSQTNTACSKSSTPGSGYIAQCFQGVNAGEPGNILATPGIHGTEAFWAGSSLNYLYVAGAGSAASPTPMIAHKMDSSGAFNQTGDPETNPKTFPYPSTVPAVSWDGSTSGSGLLWAIDAGGHGHWSANSNGVFQSYPATPAILVVYQAVPNPTTNSLTERWASTVGANSGPGAVKFTVPTVANGLVFVPGGASGYAPGPPGGTDVNCTAAALANSITPTVCQGMLSVYGKIHQ
jgi:hypothetical protein